MLNFPSRRVEVCRVQIPIENLPPHLAGTRLVQLSDFHYGDRSLPDAILQEAIALAQSLQPDLICYTGDFINGNLDQIEPLCHALASIQSRHGSLAILGNHDTLTSNHAQRVTQALQSVGIQVLNDEVAYPLGTGLAFVGFKCLPYLDRHKFRPEGVMAQVCADIPTIVLVHGPRYGDLLKPWKIDLQLSGHTHGGQLALPGFGPLIPRFWQIMNGLPESLQRSIRQALPRRIAMSQECTYMQGLYVANQGYLYTNRGLGSHFPGRVFCRPEITEFTLIPGEANDSSNPTHSSQAHSLAMIKT